MTATPLRTGAGERRFGRRLLPEGWLSGPTPWVLAIMLFLTTLAAAGGIGLGAAADRLGAGLANRATVQIIEGDAAVREAQAKAAMALLARDPAVDTAKRVGQAEMAALLEPWLGRNVGAELPLPALIDLTLTQGGAEQLPRLRAALRRVAPAAQLDDHQRALRPVTRLIETLRWLALALILLTLLATGCTVMLAAVSALDAHRATIDVMHLLGATDVQIAQLFQRRIAIGALLAGMIGVAGGVAVLAVLGRELDGLGSELAGSLALPPGGWVVLGTLPLVAALLAMAASRWTVLRALRRIL